MFLWVHFVGSFSLFSGLFLVKLIVSSLTWRPRERPSVLSWAVISFDISVKILVEVLGQNEKARLLNIPDYFGRTDAKQSAGA